MFKGCIYRHWIINENGIIRSYIGKHCGINPKRNRWGKNGWGYLKNNPKNSFARAIKKYGWENFNHEIIGWCEAKTKEQLNLDLNEWEKYYIYKYDSYKNGYNNTLGGEGTVGYHLSEQHRKNISEQKKGKVAYYPTEEQKKKRSEQFKGEKNPMYGKEVPLERRKKHSEYMTGLRVGNKHPLYGTHRTEEQKRKQSEAIKGEKHPKARKVRCMETGQVFSTVKEAGRWCNLKNEVSISEQCRGKRKTAGKHPETGKPLHWEYVD